MKNEVLDIAGVLNGFSPGFDQLNLFIVYLNFFWGVFRFEHAKNEKKYDFNFIDNLYLCENTNWF